MNAQLTDESQAVWLTSHWRVLVTEDPHDQSAPLVVDLEQDMLACHQILTVQ